MRHPASEKLEIIRIVEQSHLPAKQTLDQLGVARRTFYHSVFTHAFVQSIQQTDLHYQNCV